MRVLPLAAAVVALMACSTPGRAAEAEVPPCGDPTTKNLSIKAFGDSVAREVRTADIAERTRLLDLVEAIKKGAEFRPVSQWLEGKWMPGTDFERFRVCSYDVVPRVGAGPQRFAATVYVSRDHGGLVAMAELVDPPN